MKYILHKKICNFIFVLSKVRPESMRTKKKLISDVISVYRGVGWTPLYKYYCKNLLTEIFVKNNINRENLLK